MIDAYRPLGARRRLAPPYTPGFAQDGAAARGRGRGSTAALLRRSGSPSLALGFHALQKRLVPSQALR